jgi:hypothetical protein
MHSTGIKIIKKCISEACKKEAEVPSRSKLSRQCMKVEFVLNTNNKLLLGFVAWYSGICAPGEGEAGFQTL